MDMRITETNHRLQGHSDMHALWLEVDNHASKSERGRAYQQRVAQTVRAPSPVLSAEEKKQKMERLAQSHRLLRMKMAHTRKSPSGKTEMPRSERKAIQARLYTRRSCSPPRQKFESGQGAGHHYISPPGSRSTSPLASKRSGRSSPTLKEWNSADASPPQTEERIRRRKAVP